jgi:hypothetical protein
MLKYLNSLNKENQYTSKTRITYLITPYILATSDLKLSSLVERFIIVASKGWRSEMMKATRYVDMGTVSL